MVTVRHLACFCCKVAPQNAMQYSWATLPKTARQDSSFTSKPAQHKVTEQWSQSDLAYLCCKVVFQNAIQNNCSFQSCNVPSNSETSSLQQIPRNLNSNTPGDSKNVFLHWGNVPDPAQVNTSWAVTANSLTTQCHAYDCGLHTRLVLDGSRFKQLVKPVWTPLTSSLCLQHK